MVQDLTSLFLEIPWRHIRRVVGPLDLGPHMHPRLETPAVRGFLEAVFVAALPVNDIALLCSLVRDREQRGRRLRAARSGRYHGADHDVV